MLTVQARNIREAFYQLAKEIKKNGEIADYGNVKLLELSPVVVQMQKPLERCLVIPKRGNNIIAMIAETMWVFGGRDDVKFLSKYLPRAINFSDDGLTWRGAYGKRLLNWYGENQLKNATNLLKSRLTTGRAVISLFDPKIDSTVDAIDVPCNNWMQFLVRNNKLNMHVSLRANDLMWGFSGINTFEWSFLQELIAFWIGIETGEYYHFIGCLVLYNRHFERIDKILQNETTTDIYKLNIGMEKVKVDITEQYFEEEMKEFFEIESLFSTDFTDLDRLVIRIESIKSLFLSHVLKILLCNFLLELEMKKEFLNVFNRIINDDLKIAATEYFLRKYTFEPNYEVSLKRIFNLW